MSNQEEATGRGCLHTSAGSDASKKACFKPLLALADLAKGNKCRRSRERQAQLDTRKPNPTSPAVNNPTKCQRSFQASRASVYLTPVSDSIANRVSKSSFSCRNWRTTWNRGFCAAEFRNLELYLALVLEFCPLLTLELELGRKDLDFEETQFPKPSIARR